MGDEKPQEPHQAPQPQPAEPPVQEEIVIVTPDQHREIHDLDKDRKHI